MVGGEVEGEKTLRLAAAFAPDRVSLARSLPLPELARTLASCQSFVGHDSGISHLAGALGVEALLLWGDTEEAVWRPRNSQVAVCRHPAGLRQLPATTVFELWREWTR
jgi:heptosyltransferase-2